MVRIRAGESFRAAVQRERGLFETAPREGTTTGATSTSAGVPKERMASGEEVRRQRRRGRRRGSRLDEMVFHQESTSSGSGSYAPLVLGLPVGAGVPQNSKGSGSSAPEMPPPPQMRTEGAGVTKKSKVSGSYVPELPPPGVLMEGAVVPKKSKVSGSYGPAMPPPPGMQMGGAGVSQNSKGSGSCGSAMPLPMMPTEGASISQNSKGSGFRGCGPETPPPGMQTDGAGASQNSKGSGLYGPQIPLPQMRTEGDGVSGSCVLAMPSLGLLTEGASVSRNSKGSSSCGPAMPPLVMPTEGASVSQNSKGSGSCGPAMPPPVMQTDGASVPQNSKGSGSYAPATPPPRVRLDEAGVLELTVEDTNALDCGVCFLPLKPPIFQCNNGHVVCSLCHDKLKATGKCHVCGVTTDGNSRCHAIERLAESIRFMCPNATYGCTARPVYHDREGHWQNCPHSPCCCPEKVCCFIGPMELLLDHFACVHGWPSFTTALANGHFNVSLHDGFNFLRVDAAASSSPGILFLLNVVRSPLGRAISMLCIDTRITNNGQGQFAKEPVECELTYSRHVSSKSHSASDQLTAHYQRCRFRVALTDLSNGLPSTVDCFQFVVSNFALGEENKEAFQVEGRIFISSINLC